MFFKKRKQKKQTVESFTKTVDVLWNGIHKLDSLLEKIVQRHDVTVDTAVFIQRSVDDLISTCLIYKEHKLFHLYNEPIINKSIPLMQNVIGQIVHKAKGLFSLHNIFEMIKSRIEDEDDSEVISECRKQADDIEHEFHKLFNSVLDDYISLREAILLIRTVVSRDKMAIICGVDLYLLYEHNESIIKKSISRTVRFDKIEIDKIKEKVVNQHEQ